MVAVGIFALAGYAVISALAITMTAAVCGTAEGGQSGNFFGSIVDYVTFQSCGGLPSWVGFATFGLFVLPWFVLIFFLLGPVLSNSIGGTALLVGLLLAGVGVLVTALV